MLIDSLFSEEPWAAFADAFRHLVLPAAVLSTIPMATIARMTRASVLEVLKEDYIKTARAKGLRPVKIYFVHALKNALMPIITIIGLMVGTLLTGAILTETIFAWPGIGSYITTALLSADMNAVLGGTVVVGLVFVCLNIFSDLLYKFFDPRAK